VSLRPPPYTKHTLFPQEGADNHPSGTARVEEPDAEAQAKMSAKEREAAIK